jgi:hypothetical protein
MPLTLKGVKMPRCSQAKYLGIIINNKIFLEVLCGLCSGEGKDRKQGALSFT